MTNTLWKIIADFNAVLSLKVAVWATTATISTATDDDGVSLPAGNYFFTIDRNSASKEYIYCALSGTSLSSIQSVSRQGVLTSGFARSHRAKTATVEITDFAIIKKMLDLLDGTTSFDASNPLGYDGTATIASANQFATKEYVDGVAIAGGADSSTTVKGITKLSVAPASATNPIAYWVNDTSVVTQVGLQSWAATYGTDSGWDDTYVVALTPALTTYTDGQRLTFTPTTTNTGAFSVNFWPSVINAKTKDWNDPQSGVARAGKPITGTVLSGQFIIDNEDFATTTNKGISQFSTDAEALAWSVTNKTLTPKQWHDLYGVTKFVIWSKNITDASWTQTIAHWLWRVPLQCKVTLVRKDSNGGGANLTTMGTAFYDWTTQVSRSYDIGNDAFVSTLLATTQAGSLTSQSWVITWDSTNILIAWTKTWSPTSAPFETWCEVY